MANISAYPTITPKGADLIVGSETYDSTDPTSPKGNPTRNFTVSSIISANTGLVSYHASLVQTGTNAPVATVMSNGLSAAIVWARTGVGVYTGTLTGAFTANKTSVFVQSNQLTSPSMEADGAQGSAPTNQFPTQIQAVVTDANTITLTSFGLDGTSGAIKRDVVNCFIEIKVFS